MYLANYFGDRRMAVSRSTTFVVRVCLEINYNYQTPMSNPITVLIIVE